MNTLKLSHWRSLILSRLTDNQLKMTFDLNVLKEAWCMLDANRNPVIKNLQNLVWESIVRKENQIARNKRWCRKLIAPLKVVQ